MSAFRRLLVLLLATLLLGPLTPWGSGSARAATVGLLVDGFDNASAGPLGPRTATPAGGATFSVSGSAGHISLPGANGVSMTLAYTFATPQNLGAAGATELHIDYDSVTTANPSNQAGNITVTATDGTGQSDQAVEGITGGQTTSIVPLTGSDSFDLHGPGDQTNIVSLTIQFFPGSNVTGPHTFDISRIATINPVDVPVNQPQSISFTSTPPSPGTVGGTYNVAATGGGSGNPVTFSVGSGTTNGACTVAGSTVTFAHAGTCQVAANQAGGPGFDPAPEAHQSITVAKAAQTISFTSSPPNPGAIGGTYTVSATGGGSGNPVAFSLGAGTTNSACTVTSSTVTFAHAGTCVVAADQAGNADFNAAPQQTQTITVGKTAQAISFTSTAPSPAAIGGTYTVTATGGASGSPVTFSVGAGTTNSACTVAGSTVTFAHAGTCVVAADQTGNADFDAAPQQTQSLTVAKNAQAITFTSTPPAPAYVGTGYSVAALGGGSGNPVTFSTGSPGCTVVGSTVSFVAAGSCAIDADQAGSADFEAAPQITQIITVTKVPSAVAVDIAPTATVVGQPATATATVTPALGSAAGSVQFSVDGNPLGAPVALTGGAASLALPTTLSVGSHQVTADFAPSDTTTFATASGADSLPVGQASTSTTPTVQPTSLRAQVVATPPGAGTPTGTVRFLVDGAQVGTATLEGGVATLAYVLPSGRTSTVAAAYDGDGSFLPSSASTARTDPRITATVTGKPQRSKAGWYRGTVKVTFTCAPSGAPLTTPCPAPVVLRKNGAGQSASATVSAADGGIGTAAVTGIDIDHGKPRVTLTGVHSSGHYPSAPQAGCKAVDKLSGVAACRVRKHELSGHRVRYTATAVDKAGNRSRRSITISLSVAHVSILGLAAHHGAYDVSLGGSYTLVVIGGPRPRYVDAAVAPQQPSGLDAFFHQDGTVNGQPRWVLGVTITTDMGGHELWNLGVLQGGQLHVVKVRVH